MNLTFANKEVYIEEMVFPWDLKRQVGFHQLKSRQNIQERKL